MLKNIFFIIFLSIFILIFSYWLFNYFLNLKNQKDLNQKNDFIFVEINGYKLKVELADNFLKRAKGLSNRKEIKDDEGMLFIFDKPEIQSFWMKDMNFPIDIIWIRNNKIIGFVENVLPEPGKLDFQLKIYQSPDLVDKVLEIKQGGVKRLNIKIGDEIKFN